MKAAKAIRTAVPARSPGLARPPSLRPGAEERRDAAALIRPAVTPVSGPGHDFGRVPVYPASDTHAAGPVSESCPLGLSTPQFCPFGGACHLCPLRLSPKLVMGGPDDRLEQEADRAAELVMRMQEPAFQPGGGQEESPGCPAPGAGRHLSPSVRAFFEPRFGYDFSAVRVHDGPDAARFAQAVGACAYTLGRDIVFDAGQYRPESTDGRRLLAHELSHAIQQGVPGGGAAVLQRRVSPEIPRIRRDLTRSFWGFDWAVTDEEARDALTVLRGLSDEDLRDTVAAMERDGLVDTLFAELGEDDVRENQDELRRIANARVRTATTSEGETTVTTTLRGSCDLGQAQEVRLAADRALHWLDRVVGRIDAYRGAPDAGATRDVREAYNRYFKSVDPRVVAYVRGQLHHIRSDMRTLDPFAVECHGTWDRVCDVAAAYVPGDDRERVVFCEGFFEGSSAPTDEQSATVVHEMAHTQVGGAHIADRAYARDRALRILSTEEALTNAASYELFVRHLATGAAPPGRAPRDTFEDCPGDWKRALEVALARAQRWNRDGQVRLSRLTPEGAAGWSAQDRQYLGGASQSAIDRAKEAFNRLATRLRSSVSFECEPEGGGRCDRGARTYWYAVGDLHVCPLWMRGGTDERILALLRGLYGYCAGVDEDERRRRYALLARGSTKAVPTLATVLGNPSWTADELRVWFEIHQPPGARTHYVESGSRHERLSNDLPSYEGPVCQTSALPFRCEVYFTVDRSGMARPAPFTPPRVSVLFRYGPATLASHRDPRPDYSRPNTILDTDFPKEFTFVLGRNDPLEMRFELVDPDTATTRLYEDTIQVLAFRPCDFPLPEREERYA